MRPSRSWLLLLCLVPVRGAAQLAPVGIPRGMFRFEVDGSFQYANDRYNDGTKESLGANFTSAALGAAEIPTLAEADARIAVLLGDPGYKLSLGASVGTAQMSTGTGAFSLGLGITKGLSIFGRLPIVSSWWRQSVSLDTAAPTQVSTWRSRGAPCRRHSSPPSIHHSPTCRTGSHQGYTMAIPGRRHSRCRRSPPDSRCRTASMP